MFGARVFARLETNLNALAEARGELELTILMAYVEAVRVDAPPKGQRTES